MRRDIITNSLLGATVVILMSALFYLTQESYRQLIKSNQATVETNNLISGYQSVANDFKNAVIYISTYRNSPSQEYLNTYGKGIWESQFHILRLKRLVTHREKSKLDAFAKQMNLEENWLKSSNPDDVELYDDRHKHMTSIISIQSFFDNKILELKQKGIENINISERSLSHLNHWINSLIISSALIMFLSVALIYRQLAKVKLKNTQLQEIAWIQSHMVRAQVANLLGLGQLLNLEESPDSDNNIIFTNMIDTSLKLDEIVREINKKAS
jgi:hypothetical protein